MLPSKPQSPFRSTISHSLDISIRILHTHLKITVTSKPRQFIFLPFSRQNSLCFTGWILGREIWEEGIIGAEEFVEEVMVLFGAFSMYECGEVGGAIAV